MSMRKCGPAKEKKKLGRSHSNFRKLQVLSRPVSSSAIVNTLHLKHFPLTDIRDSIKSELSLTQVRIV